MNRRLALVLVAAAALAVGSSTVGDDDTSADPEAAQPELTLSDPVTRGNLTVYFIHGQDRFRGNRFQTLSQALAGGRISITENGDESSVTARVGGRTTFIQAGETLRGGRQDRVIATDMILQPGRSPTQIPVRCIEPGRWTPGTVNVHEAFVASKSIVPGAAMRAAVIRGAPQRTITSLAASLQQRLSAKVDADVAVHMSPTSLARSLVHSAVRAAIVGYVDAIEPAPEDLRHLVGVVIVINGRIGIADVYGCDTLFIAQWPKLIRSAAIWALLARGADAAEAPATPDDVQAFLTARETPGEVIRQGAGRGFTVTVEANPAALTAQCKDDTGTLIHECLIPTSPTTETQADADEQTEDQAQADPSEPTEPS